MKVGKRVLTVVAGEDTVTYTERLTPVCHPPQIPAQSRRPWLSDRSVVTLSKQSAQLMHENVSSSQNVGI